MKKTKGKHIAITPYKTNVKHNKSEQANNDEPETNMNTE